MDGTPQDAKAQITVTRNSPEDVQQRQVIVKLDGEKMGELMYGETLTMPVSAGHHRLQVDNTWKRKTVELDIAAGEHAKYKATSKAGRFMSFLAETLGGGPMDVFLQREE